MYKQMKKKYMAPAINVVRIDGNVMTMAMSDGSANGSENYSKYNVVSFDDDDDDMTSAW